MVSVTITQDPRLLFMLAVFVCFVCLSKIGQGNQKVSTLVARGLARLSTVGCRFVKDDVSVDGFFFESTRLQTEPGTLTNSLHQINLKSGGFIGQVIFTSDCWQEVIYFFCRHYALSQFHHRVGRSNILRSEPESKALPTVVRKKYFLLTVRERYNILRRLRPDQEKPISRLSTKRRFFRLSSGRSRLVLSAGQR
jgi:hypothetical protein